MMDPTWPERILFGQDLTRKRTEIDVLTKGNPQQSFRPGYGKTLDLAKAGK
jgi:hypothetical protein